MNKDRINQAFNDAIAQRGKRKGLLKAQCPPMGTDGAAMWQALMMEVNPYKVGLGHLVLMTQEQREFYNACVTYAENLHSLVKAGIDLDRARLEAMGAW